MKFKAGDRVVIIPNKNSYSAGFRGVIETGVVIGGFISVRWDHVSDNDVILPHPFTQTIRVDCIALDNWLELCAEADKIRLVLTE